MRLVATIKTRLRLGGPRVYQWSKRSTAVVDIVSSVIAVFTIWNEELLVFGGWKVCAAESRSKRICTTLKRVRICVSMTSDSVFTDMSWRFERSLRRRRHRFNDGRRYLDTSAARVFGAICFRMTGSLGQGLTNINISTDSLQLHNHSELLARPPKQSESTYQYPVF